MAEKQKPVSKRPHTETEAPMDGEDPFHECDDKPYSKSEVDDIMSALRTDMLDVVASKNKEMAEALFGRVFGAVQKLDNKVTQQYDALAHQVEDVDTRLSAVATEQKSMWQAIGDLRAALGRAEALVPDAEPTMDPLEWNRAPDPTIMVLRFAEIMSLDLVKASLPAIHEALGTQSDWFTVRGPVIGRKYTLQFSGGTGLASQRVDNIMRGMYDRNTGQWKQLPVRNVDNEVIFPMVFRDQGPREDALGAAGRGMARIIRTTMGLQDGDKRVHLNKKDHTIHIDLVPTCRITSPGPDKVEFKWRLEALLKHKLVKSDLLEKYDNRSSSSASSRPDDEGWSL